MKRIFSLSFLLLTLFTACAPSPAVQGNAAFAPSSALPVTEGFLAADGSRPLTFPLDFGAHEDFRTEWWYYTGNLAHPSGREFGFELTIFRVGLLPPGSPLPTSESTW